MAKILGEILEEIGEWLRPRELMAMSHACGVSAMGRGVRLWERYCRRLREGEKSGDVIHIYEHNTRRRKGFRSRFVVAVDLEIRELVACLVHFALIDGQYMLFWKEREIRKSSTAKINEVGWKFSLGERDTYALTEQGVADHPIFGDRYFRPDPMGFNLLVDRHSISWLTVVFVNGAPIQGYDAAKSITNGSKLRIVRSETGVELHIGLPKATPWTSLALCPQMLKVGLFEPFEPFEPIDLSLKFNVGGIGATSSLALAEPWYNGGPVATTKDARLACCSEEEIGEPLIMRRIMEFTSDRTNSETAREFADRYL
jgi:hypothetical protein